MRALLLLACVVMLAGGEARERARLAADGFAANPAAFRIDTGPAVTVEAVLASTITVTGMQVATWQFFIPSPPDLDGQQCLTAKLAPGGRPERENSSLRRPMLIATVPAPSANRERIAVEARYRLELSSRTLRDLSDQPAAKPLTDMQRRAALAVTTQLDWDSKAFQAWLDRQGFRPRATESDVAFARRCHRDLRKSLRYSYTEDMDRIASHVAAAGTGDCGGWAGVYTAVLRANGIPARVLMGRWAKSATPEDRLEGLPYGQWHVKMEFFASGAGWVPCDVTTAYTQPDAWFGRDDGDFITMHIDAGLELDTLAGAKTSDCLQRFLYWVNGTGTFRGSSAIETWTVTRP